MKKEPKDAPFYLNDSEAQAWADGYNKAIRDHERRNDKN